MIGQELGPVERSQGYPNYFFISWLPWQPGLHSTFKSIDFILFCGCTFIPKMKMIRQELGSVEHSQGNLNYFFISWLPWQPRLRPTPKLIGFIFLCWCTFIPKKKKNRQELGPVQHSQVYLNYFLISWLPWQPRLRPTHKSIGFILYP